MAPREPVVGPAHSLRAGRGWMRRLSTQNPFYVISAALVLTGLRVAFEARVATFPSWAVLASLAAYTALLAVTACGLVRLGNVWDDVRSVALLALLGSLATAAFFDDVRLERLAPGPSLDFAGWLFAAAVAEGLIQGMRLRLPWRFRGPYHLIVAVYFLYPIVLRGAADPADPALLWALAGFPTVAAGAFLSLIPAARRGPIAKSGVPWAWPWYPWSAFVFLAVGIIGRSYYLCLSTNYSGGSGGYESVLATMFGPYLLAPLVLAAAWVMLEGASAAGHHGLRRAALLGPIAALVLAGIGHRPDAAYGRFLGLFHDRLGAYPLQAAALVGLGFYGLACLKRVPGALSALSLGLTAVACVPVDSPSLGIPETLQWAPLTAFAVLQAALAVRRRSTLPALLAAAAGLSALWFGPMATWAPIDRLVVSTSLTVITVLVLGALFDDTFARVLRALGVPFLVGVCLASAAGGEAAAHLPAGTPALWIALGLTYGFVLGDRRYIATATLLLGGFAVAAGWRGFDLLRRRVPGVDRVALGLVFFALAAAVSVLKSGFGRRKFNVPDASSHPDGS